MVLKNRADHCPVLVPDFSYSGLEIQKGDVAQLKYQELINSPDKNFDRAKIKMALLEYCSLDKRAMVYILNELQCRTFNL